MTAGPRPIDALVAEIGSTTTVVSAFEGLRRYPAATPRLVGQGVTATTVGRAPESAGRAPGPPAAGGDVTMGVQAARAKLEAAVGPLEPELTLATSSAAGGLRMTVHGLTRRMTAMAAREAALGAGAVVKYQTAGPLRPHDLREIDAVRPNLILLAGGVEGGDCDTVLFNAGELTKLEARPIVVYAGNSVVCSDAQELLEKAGFRVRLTNNVYPAVDELDIVPARHVIHDAFEEHITHAPGMERIGDIVSGRILPTPGAVLIAAERLAEEVGDLVVVDVGGATTDVHSVTDGSPEIAALATEPQPHSKRTVEGDLGTYVSAPHVVQMLAEQERPVHLPPALPRDGEEVAAALTLTHFAAVTGVQRHAGQLTHLYTPTGRQTVARGRDLTACRLVIGTGGALTRLPGGAAVLADARAKGTGRAGGGAAEGAGGGGGGGTRLLPPPDARIALDRDYIFACCGALLQHFDAGAVTALLRASTGV